MENVNEFGTQISPEEAMEEIEKVRQEQKENSRFIILEPDSAEEVDLTGTIYARHSTGTDAATGKSWERDVLDFETTDVTPNGENKIISFAKTNKITPQIIQAIREGRKKLTISRQGAGQNTRYSIIEVKKKRGASTL